MSSSAGHAQHEVVVVGGGFGGLQAVRQLRRAPVSVTLVDRRSFHLFQPLVYQVATGMLAAGEIAAPLRSVFKRDRNVRVILGEVSGFDLAGRRVLLERLPNGDPERELTYDSLIVAAGSCYTYFGHDEWRAVAPDVKSLESALAVRGRILTAFEAAEVEEDPGRRAAWLTFVVVGAGPTGVELAGQIAEMARHTLRDEYRAADMRSARIVLVEMADRVLPTFPATLSDRARRDLEHLGVEPLIGHRVVDVDEDCVTVSPAAGGEPTQIPARTAVWSAGVVATALATALATESGAQLDRGGRVAVGPDLSVAGHPEVLALGDMARVHDGQGRPLPLPGPAPVAMQQGRHAARVIGNRLSGRQTPPFRYRDKGGLATIGRAKAVAEIRRLGLSGLPAWLAWLLVHLFYLIGLQNRLLVLVRWMFSYVTRSGGARLIAGSEVTLARRTRHRRASQSPAMKPSTTEPRPVVKTRVPDGYRVPDRPRTRGAGLMATGSPVPRRRCSSILPLDRHGRHAAGEVAWRRVRGRPAGKWGLERDCRAPARGRSGSGPGAAVRRVWCRCCDVPGVRSFPERAQAA